MHAEFPQPLHVGRVELTPGPAQRLFREGIQSFLKEFLRGLLVVVAFDRGAIEFADDVHAFFRVSAVAYDVSHADMVRDLLLGSIRQNSMERMQVGVDISEDGKSHGVVSAQNWERRTIRGRSREYPVCFPSAARG